MNDDGRLARNSKRAYVSPKLTEFGTVKALTHGNVGSFTDGNSQNAAEV